MLPATHSYPHLPLWLHFLLRAGSFNVLALLLGPLFWFAWPKPAFLLGQCRLYGHSAESHSLRIICLLGFGSSVHYLKYITGKKLNLALLAS